MKKLSFLLILGLFLSITSCKDSVSGITEENFQTFVADFEKQISETKTINADNKDEFIRQALTDGYSMEEIEGILGNQNFLDYMNEKPANQGNNRTNCRYRKTACFTVFISQNRYNMIYSNTTDSGNYFEIYLPGYVTPLVFEAGGQNCNTLYTQPISCTDMIGNLIIKKLNGNGVVDCTQVIPRCSYNN